MAPLSQLYFLHIPKTAGSSLTRLLEDSWPAGAMAPQRFMDELADVSAEELGRYEVLAGHHGLLPVTERSVIVTLLREPGERAWSHYRGHLRVNGEVRGQAVPRFESFEAFLDDPVHGWMSRDFQARWLGVAPDEPSVMKPNWLPPGVPASEAEAHEWAPDDTDLERRAMAALQRCALVGTVERFHDFIEGLGRLIGRPLEQPPRLNAAPRSDGMPAKFAELVRSRSPIDIRLHAAADAALDRALATLPPIPAEPPAELPYEYEMSQAFSGTGWHSRLHTPEAGWHRWTGPGTTSELRLPVRLAGRARLAIAIPSACDDEAVDSLHVTVQGRVVRHALDTHSVGTSAVTEVELDPREPLTVRLEIAHTKHLLDPASGERSADPAGLAVSSLSFSG